MRKRTICALITSLGFTGCAFLSQTSVTENQKEVVNLNNGYTTERPALNLLYSEAKKLEGTIIKTKSGLHPVKNFKDAVYRLCELTDGVFLYEDSDYFVSLEELKEFVRRQK